jgi:hypothetical protein
MQVNYVTACKETMPAYRYRMRIPGKQMDAYGISHYPVTADIHVFSKPYISDPTTLMAMMNMSQGIDYVFDLCDDIFRREYVGNYLRYMISNAKAVTCSTEGMKDIIFEETGVTAHVISDPTEFEEKPIKDISTPRVMWFGSATNFDILKYVHCPYPVEIVSDISVKDRLKSGAVSFDWTFTEWSLDAMKSAFMRNNIAIIPTFNDKNENHNYTTKSPNRVFEAIRNGLSVVAAPIPEYQKFKDFITLDWDMENGLKNIRQITPEAQKYVRDNHSPEVIGNQWKQLFRSLLETSESTSVVAAAS